MTLSELKKEVDGAIESAIDQGQNPDDIIVSLQIEGAGDGSILGNGAVWAKDEIELHYDNDGQASGCVLVGYPGEEEVQVSEEPVNIESELNWQSVSETPAPHGIPVWCCNPAWINEDFNPEGIREGFWNDDGYWITCGWDPCNDVFTTIEQDTPTMWATRVKPNCQVA